MFALIIRVLPRFDLPSVAYRRFSTGRLNWNASGRLQAETNGLNATDDEKFSGILPLEQLQITYGTSSAPGGQNVNKRCTRVDVRFHLPSASWVPENVRQQLRQDYPHRINKENMFCVRSERTRSQTLNLADCLDKLRCTIRETEAKLRKPELSKETQEVIRWRKINAARKRLETKRLRAEKRFNFT